MKKWFEETFGKEPQPRKMKYLAESSLQYMNGGHPWANVEELFASTCTLMSISEAAFKARVHEVTQSQKNELKSILQTFYDRLQTVEQRRNFHAPMSTRMKERMKFLSEA